VEPEFVHCNTGGRRGRGRVGEGAGAGGAGEGGAGGVAGSLWGGDPNIHSFLPWTVTVMTVSSRRSAVMMLRWRTLLNTGGCQETWLAATAVTAGSSSGPQETQSVTHVVPAQLSQPAHRNLGWQSQTRLRRERGSWCQCHGSHGTSERAGSCCWGEAAVTVAGNSRVSLE